MNTKSALIVSPLPLKPVKSGMQNTIFLLYKYLKGNKYKIFFHQLKTNSKIDPILNLKKDKNLINQINKKIGVYKIDFIFINTSKILFQYKSFLLNKNRCFKTILVCHDLYYFRKKYFDKIKIKDKTKLKFIDEINILKQVDYITDFSNQEFRFLKKQKILKSKIIKTITPTVKFKKVEIKKNKKYDILYISSNWYQNYLSLNFFFREIGIKKKKFKILILGKLSMKTSKNIKIRPYSTKMFNKCKIGIAIMKDSTGRQTKIFEMLSAGLPIFTNIDLSEFGLKNNVHYKLFDKKKDLIKQLDLFISNDELKKKISRNAFKWSKKNTFYKKAFERLNNQILMKN